MKKIFFLILVIAGFCFAQKIHDINRYIENPAMTAENQEPPHVPLMPFVDGEQAKTCDWQRSPFLQSLDGTWKFKWVPRPEEVPDGFFNPDFSVEKWDNIKVPGTWQMQEYDHIIYRNIPMEFDPYNPPCVPDLFNPTGCYRTIFSLPKDWQGRQILLHFDGVQSAYFVWVNGHYVGYDEDAMTAGEFNITPFLRNGENVLAVQVMRWSDGSYLEDQDMWRFSGIYRQVYIYSVPQVHLRDYFVKTDLDAQYCDATLTIDAEIMNYTDRMANPYKIEADLYDADGRTVAQLTTSATVKAKDAARVRLLKVIKNPKKWSDEKPHRYTLVLSLLNGQNSVVDVVSQKMGFREIEVRNEQILINGQAVDFKGVNRHEHHPELGRTLTVDMMRKDLALMKQFNVNAVRHSHYPNDPRWYDLCDEYGIYICDEVNAECHQGENWLADVPGWEPSFMHRFEHMVQRDKNFASVIFWSTGNECGLGHVHYMMNEYARKVDPTRLLYHQSNVPDGEAPYADVIGPRYPTPARLRQIGRGPGKPVVMGEYAHAMENSLGHFDEFWQTIYELPRLQGGFVWDWVDQGLRQKIISTPDASRFHTQAVFRGRPQIVAGKSGQAVALSGVDDWVELYDDPCLDITGAQLTVMVTVYPRGFYSANPLLTKGDHQFGLAQIDPSKLEFYIQDDNKHITVQAPVPGDWDYNWHTVAGVYNGQQLVLYLDGKQLAVKEHKGKITSCHYPINLGRNAERHLDNDQTWISNAIYDQAAIYNRALSAEEIANPAKAPTMGVVLWLDLDEFQNEGDYIGYGSSNFLINGVIFADRTPQPELWQMKKSHEPVWVRVLDAGRAKFEINNRYFFTNLGELDVIWQLAADGKELQNGKIKLDVAPQKNTVITIPYEITAPQPGVEYWLTLSFQQSAARPGIPVGHEVAFAQCKLPVTANNRAIERSISTPAAVAIEDASSFIIKGSNFEYAFDKKQGCLSAMKYQQQDLISNGPQLNVWRAMISNEYVEWGRAEGKEWWRAGLDRMVENTLSYGMENLNGGVLRIIFTTRCQAPDVPEGFDNVYTYDIYPAGDILFNHHITPFGNLIMDWLPHMGIQLQMPERFKQLTWYGRGPIETYPDRKTGAKIGLYSGSVEEQYVPYVRPMEHGNKTEVRWAALTDEQGLGLLFIAQPEMNVSVTPFNNLHRACYTFQLKRSGTTIVNLLHRVTGVGDTPNPVLPQYRTFPIADGYSIRLKPFLNKEIDPAVLARQAITD